MKGRTRTNALVAMMAALLGLAGAGAARADEPVIEGSTVMAGLYGIAEGGTVDAAGNVYISGEAGGFVPGLPPEQQPPALGSHFFAKLDPTATQVEWITWFTVNELLHGRELVVDGAGNLYLGGITRATDLPTTAGAYQTTLPVDPSETSAWANRAFLMKVSPQGAILYATYFGKPFGQNEITGVAVDGNGLVTVAGNVHGNLPVKGNPYDSTFSGGYEDDAFIARFDPARSGDASLLYSTYLGGTARESAEGVAVDAAGNAYVVGSVRNGGAGFPVVNGFQTTGSGSEAFLVKLDYARAGAAALSYATLIGGVDDTGSGTGGRAIAVTPEGIAYAVVGMGTSSFPTPPGAYRPSGGHTMVLAVDASKAGAASLRAATFLGLGPDDLGSAIVLDAAGEVHVAGTTRGSAEFVPIVCATTCARGTDAFVARLDPGLGTLRYGVELGGDSLDWVNGLGVNAAGEPTIVGTTIARKFPTTPGAFQEVVNSLPGSHSIYAAKLGAGGPQLLCAHLELQKTASQEPVVVGQEFSYTITARNVGPQQGTATAVRVTDFMPDHVEPLSIVASQGTCTNGLDPSCDLGGLARDATATITIVARAVPRIEYVPEWDAYAPVEQWPATNSAFYTLRELDPTCPVAGTVTSTVVQPANQAPAVALDAAAMDVAEGSAATISGSIVDGDGDPLLAFVSFGDAALGEPLALAGDGGFSVQHVYPDDGSYTVTVLGDDAQGGITTGAATVTAHNVAPELGSLLGAVTLHVGEPLELQATLDDPGLLDTHAAVFSWGDGATSGGTVVEPAAGQAGLVSGAHTYAQAGAHTVALEVADDDGGTAGATLIVNVLSHPPAASAGADQTVCGGDLVQLAGSASDPDGDALALQWAQVPAPTVSLAGATTAQASFTAPAVAATTVLTFTLTATDPYGLAASAVGNVTVKHTNLAPVAMAGPDQLTAEGSAVTLDASASYDPQGDALSYAWTQLGGPAVALAGADTAAPTFTAPEVAGSSVALVFQLAVTDVPAGACGQPLTAVSAVTVTVEDVNHAPTAVLDGPAAAGEGSAVVLSGAGSSDPDQDPLTYAFAQVAGPQVALAPQGAAAAMGFVAPPVAADTTLVFLLTVTDSHGAAAMATLAMVIKDAAAPMDCAHATAGVETLWPPSHRLAPVAIALEGTAGATVQVTSVRQDEPLDGLGDGDTAPDAVLSADGGVLLRAERAGTGDGRVYRIGFHATGAGGQSCDGEVFVGVPHDKKDAPVAGPFSFSSF